MIISTQAMVSCTKMIKAYWFIKTIQDTGIIIFEQYRDGRKNGVAKTFYSKIYPDQLKDIQRIDFMVCKIVGGLMAQKSQALYVNGQRNGIIMNGIVTDSLKGEMRYKKGLQYGDQKGWKENGDLKIQLYIQER